MKTERNRPIKPDVPVKDHPGDVGGDGTGSGINTNPNRKPPHDNLLTIIGAVFLGILILMIAVKAELGAIIFTAVIAGIVFLLIKKRGKRDY